MVYGLWFMFYGSRFMVEDLWMWGLRFMDYCVWFMVHGGGCEDVGYPAVLARLALERTCQAGSYSTT